ncbi:MAG: hypothetical protein K0S33_138 [Bacteroidetes bacterium]|nr:hypothetical protein [Bacteroidota bacterium]
MPPKNTYLLLFVLLVYGRLNATNTLLPVKGTEDSLRPADTVLITTGLFSEEKIYAVDSICKNREQILDKMPAPVFMRPEGGKDVYIGNDAYRTEYDSINTLISVRGYKEKKGADTLGDIVREMYTFNGSTDYFRVKYSNYKTGELLMVVITEYMTLNYTVTYFSENKVIKTDHYSILDPTYKSVSHLSAWYEKGALIGARIVNANNCKINFISHYSEMCTISFDECIDVSFYNRIPANRFSKKAIKKEEKRSWVKIK